MRRFFKCWNSNSNCWTTAELQSCTLRRLGRTNQDFGIFRCHNCVTILWLCLACEELKFSPHQDINKLPGKNLTYTLTGCQTTLKADGNFKFLSVPIYFFRTIWRLIKLYIIIGPTSGVFMAVVKYSLTSLQGPIRKNFSDIN